MSRNRTSRSDPPGRTGYVLLPPEEVPPGWQRRAVSLSLVALLPEERQQLLEEGRTPPALDPEDEWIARLVAGGLGPTAIAARMGISTRTVERRLARLRRRFGARTSAQLTALLSGMPALAEVGHRLSEEGNGSRRTSQPRGSSRRGQR